MKNLHRPNLATVVALCFIVSSHGALAANGCVDNFSDRRSQNPVVITAALCPVLDYSPRCARVSAGSTVRFDVAFNCHPTFGGVVSGDTASFDATSPIGPWLSGGPYSVTLDAPGEFPYFCDFHYRMGMTGSILVVPETFASGFED